MAEQKKEPAPHNIASNYAAIGEAYRSRGTAPVYTTTGSTAAGPSPFSEPCTKCRITWDGKLKINMRECTNKCKES